MILGLRQEELTIRLVEQAWQRQVESAGSATETERALTLARDTLIKWLRGGEDNHQPSGVPRKPLPSSGSSAVALPKLQTENAGGNGPGRRTRIGSNNPDENSKFIRIDDMMSPSQLASTLGLKETEVIKRLFMEGVPRTVNQPVEVEWARKLATELGFRVMT